MDVLAISLYKNSIQSAIFCEEDHTPQQYRETAWNDKRGIEELFSTLRQVTETYDTYSCLGVCFNIMWGQGERRKVLGPYDLSGCNMFSLRTILEEYIKVPIFMEQRVNSTAVAEARLGAGKGMESLLYIHYGATVSSGIVLDGRLYTGSQGLAGEIGHTVLHADGRACTCGQRGCYEAYASVEALLIHAHRLDSSISNGIELMEAVYDGNLSVKSALLRWITEVVAGLLNGIYLLNPTGIILGGGICREDYIFERIRMELYNRLLPAYQNVRIGRATLGSKAALQGISIMTREHYSKEQ